VQPRGGQSTSQPEIPVPMAQPQASFPLAHPQAYPIKVPAEERRGHLSLTPNNRYQEAPSKYQLV